MPDHPQADAIFAALADPTRRAILQMLRERDLTVHEIAAAFAISRPAVSKHLRVLREAGLVRDREVGRTRVHQLATGPAAALLLAWSRALAGGPLPTDTTAAEPTPQVHTGREVGAKAATPAASRRRAERSAAATPARPADGPGMISRPAPRVDLNRPRAGPWEPWRR